MIKEFLGNLCVTILSMVLLTIAILSLVEVGKFLMSINSMWGMVLIGGGIFSVITAGVLTYRER